jgi:hypothetical protein
MYQKFDNGMELDNFAPTRNLIERRASNARPQRRAFFMPYSHLFDATHRISAVASDNHHSHNSRFVIRLSMNFLLTGQAATVFFAANQTRNSSMAQSTNPVPTKHTVEVSTCQLAILNHFHSKDAQEMARLIRSVCTAAIKSETADYEDITCLFQFSEYVQELSNEHFAAAVEFHHQNKKFI